MPLATEMANVELVLLGEPRLLIDGREEKIVPKRAFEVAARIIWAGTASVSRAELQAFFWGHLAEKNAGQQLRLVLLKLRREFARLGIDDFFELDGPVLRLTQPVAVDLQRLATVEHWTLEEAQALLVPVAAGWDQEHWFAQSDFAGDVLARAIQSCVKAEASPEPVIELLTQGCRVHPTGVSLYQQLYALYHKLGREAEANEVIIQFESAWVDRFGTGQIPTLGIGPEAPTIVVRAPVVSSRAPTVPLVAVAVAALVFTIYATLSSSPLRSFGDQHPDLKVVSSRTVTVDGIEYVVARLKCPGPPTPELSLLTDGTIRVLAKGSSRPYFFRLNGKTIEWDANAHPGLASRFGKLTVTEIGNPVNQLVVANGQSSTPSIVSNATHPRLGEPKIFAGEGICFSRSCLDPLICHRLTFFWKDGVATPIEGELTANSAPAQVSVITAMDDKSIYGKYSAGKLDGWEYSPFRFDIESGQAESVGGDPVGGISSHGDLALLPEISDIDKATGDINTHWTGKVNIKLKEGKRFTLKVEGQDTFHEFRSVGNLLFVQLSRHPIAPNLRVVDYAGKPVAGFEPELSQGWELHLMEVGMGVRLISRQGNDVILILKTPHALDSQK